MIFPITLDITFIFMYLFPFSFAYEKGLPESSGKPFISLFFYSLSNAV